MLNSLFELRLELARHGVCGIDALATEHQVQHRHDDEAAADAEPLIARHYATVGSRSASGGVSVNTKAENLGQLNLVMADRGDSEGEIAVADRLRARFTAMPALEVKFGRPAYFSLKTPVEVIIFGDDLADLRTYSLDLARRLEDVPGLVDVRSSLEAGNPELQVVFDRDRLAAMYGDQGGLVVGRVENDYQVRVHFPYVPPEPKDQAPCAS